MSVKYFTIYCEFYVSIPCCKSNYCFLPPHVNSHCYFCVYFKKYSCGPSPELKDFYTLCCSTLCNSMYPVCLNGEAVHVFFERKYFPLLLWQPAVRKCMKKGLSRREFSGIEVILPRNSCRKVYLP